MNENVDTREKTIVRTSIIGIAANVLLAVFKAIIGLASNSIQKEYPDYQLQLTMDTDFSEE